MLRRPILSVLFTSFLLGALGCAEMKIPAYTPVPPTAPPAVRQYELRKHSILLKSAAFGSVIPEICDRVYSFGQIGDCVRRSGDAADADRISAGQSMELGWDIGLTVLGVATTPFVIGPFIIIFGVTTVHSNAVNHYYKPAIEGFNKGLRQDLGLAGAGPAAPPAPEMLP